MKEQADNFEKVRKDEFKQSKYVLIKVSLMLQTFSNILDRLIVNNDYNRILLFSGEDGFYFYDDFNKLSIEFLFISMVFLNCSWFVSLIIIFFITTQETYFIFGGISIN